MSAQTSYLWLFPLTYAIHIAEEGFAGERFYHWIDRVPLVRALGVRVSECEFFAMNAIYMLAMIVSVIAASRAGYSWLVPALGTLVAVNSAGHLIGSVATRSYSPGLASGLLLWLPLGIATLLQAHRALAPSEMWAGLTAGISVQVFVVVSSLAVGRWGRPMRSSLR
jgi:hypothetical protein